MLSVFFLCRTGQVFELDKRTHPTLHEVQNSRRNSRPDLPDLSKGVPSLEARLWDCQSPEMETILFLPMQSRGFFKTKTKSPQRVLCGMREPVSTTNWKSDRVFSSLQSDQRSPMEKEESMEVYNIEVEGNHNYFANDVLVANCDEAAYVPEEIIMDVAMPMLAAKNGTIILISSPCDKKHFFYRMFNSDRWSKYHFKTADNPLVSREFLEEAREEIGESRFRREYLAEFMDDEKTYFPMALLRAAVHVCGSKSCAYCGVLSGTASPAGDLYAGYDPGGLTDPAALVWCSVQ